MNIVNNHSASSGHESRQQNEFKANNLPARLKQIRPEVTDSIRMKAALALKCSYKDVGSYLKGNINDPEFALHLIDTLHFLINGSYADLHPNFSDLHTGLFIERVNDLLTNTYIECHRTIWHIQKFMDIAESRHNEMVRLLINSTTNNNVPSN